MNIQAFPILIKYIEDFITEEENSALLSIINNIDTQPHGALKGNSSSSFGLKGDILSNFTDLKEKILAISNEYCREYGIAPVMITNSWINIQNKESILEKHTHPRSIISGALYINKNEDAANLHFHNPNPFMTLIERGQLKTEYTCKTISVKAKKNSLILFPSWLSHSTEEPNNMENRIVLSFNTELK